MESKSSKRKMLAFQREEEALAYRKTGMTFAEIGRAMNIDGSRAYQLVDVALTRYKNHMSHKADEVRQLELERLDALLNAAWPAAMNGDTKSIQAALKVCERRAKLVGIDAPVNVTLNDQSQTAEQLEAELRKRLAEQAEERK